MAHYKLTMSEILSKLASLTHIPGNRNYARWETVKLQILADLSCSNQQKSDHSLVGFLKGKMP